MPASVTELKPGWQNYTALKEMRGASVTDISGGMFENCISLKTVDFPKAVAIGNGAFAGCTSLETASFPEAVSVGDYTFAHCESLKMVSLPKVTSFGKYVFTSYSGKIYNTITIILGATPPTVNVDISQNECLFLCGVCEITLKAPAGSVSAYQTWVTDNKAKPGSQNTYKVEAITG